MKKRFRHIYLEITNICNLSCPFCSIDHRHKEFMTLDDLKKYALMCKEYTDNLYLHIKGEPLLHPDFKGILAFLSENSINVKITTNGDFLVKQEDVLLNAKNILRMNISLQSLVTKSLDEVDVYLKKLVGFLNKVKEKGNFSVSLRLWNDKDNEKVDNYNDYIKQYLEKYYGNPFIDSKTLTNHIYASIEDEFSWPNTLNEYNAGLTKCLGGSTHIGILVNGDVVLCCLDSNGDTLLGSLKENSLRDIIESDKFNKIVSDLRNGKYFFDICKKCTYRNRFR